MTPSRRSVMTEGSQSTPQSSTKAVCHVSFGLNYSKVDHAKITANMLAFDTRSCVSVPPAAEYSVLVALNSSR